MDDYYKRTILATSIFEGLYLTIGPTTIKSIIRQSQAKRLTSFRMCCDGV